MKTISSLAMSIDGQMIAVGGKDGQIGQIGLWRVQDDNVQLVGQSFVQMTKAPIDALAFCADGKQLASTHGVGYDHLAHLWRGQGHKAGPEWRTLCSSDRSLYGVAISPNGRFLATAGHDKLVYLWDITTGQLRQTFRGHTNSIYYGFVHN